MILIYPPVAKSCEPPPGLARLSGALKKYEVNHFLLDANLEGLLYIMQARQLQTAERTDTWTTRAFRDLTRNLDSLRAWKLYRSIDKYKRAVFDIDHAAEMSADNGFTLGLADIHHQELSPLRSNDLLRASELPEKNPFYPYFSERFPALINEQGPALIGFSLNYLSQALCTFAMIGFLKRTFPGLKIILGGGLVTSWMRNPSWKDPFGGLVDHLVAGPGEHYLLSISGTDNIRQEHITPSYDTLPLHDYLSPGLILPYSASSGCYWSRCSFCPEKAEDNPYIPIPADTVVHDLNTLITRTGSSIVHLLDNSINPAVLKRLSSNPMQVAWYGFARISRSLTDIDFCMSLKKAGCIMLKLGIESGDQGVLDSMQKQIDTETVSEVLRALKKAGIAAYVYLLFGTPAESLTEARKTLDFVVRHRHEISFLNLAIFNMPVCSPETEKYRTKRFYEGDLSLYTDFDHPRGWNRKQVRTFLDSEFKKNRAVADILKNDPPVFTSNHAPLFTLMAETSK